MYLNNPSLFRYHQQVALRLLYLSAIPPPVHHDFELRRCAVGMGRGDDHIS